MAERSAHELLQTRNCKTPHCTNEANTRYDRGVFAGLCEEVCIPARREQLRKPRTGQDAAAPKPRAATTPGNRGFEQRARELVSVGKQLDQALRRVDVVKQRHDEEDRGRGERRRVELRPKQDAVNEALAAWKQTLQHIADAA